MDQKKYCEQIYYKLIDVLNNNNIVRRVDGKQYFYVFGIDNWWQLCSYGL